MSNDIETDILLCILERKKFTDFSHNYHLQDLQSCKENNNNGRNSYIVDLEDKRKMTAYLGSWQSWDEWLAEAKVKKKGVMKTLDSITLLDVHLAQLNVLPLSLNMSLGSIFFLLFSVTFLLIWLSGYNSICIFF